jgi:hypothetical protein
MTRPRMLSQRCLSMIVRRILTSENVNDRLGNDPFQGREIARARLLVDSLLAPHNRPHFRPSPSSSERAHPETGQVGHPMR